MNKLQSININNYKSINRENNLFIRNNRVLEQKYNIYEYSSQHEINRVSKILTKKREKLLNSIKSNLELFINKIDKSKNILYEDLEGKLFKKLIYLRVQNSYKRLIKIYKENKKLKKILKLLTKYNNTLETNLNYHNLKDMDF